MADEDKFPTQDDGKKHRGRLKIHTVLDSLPSEKQLPGDPLLLLWAKGTEDFSKPFSYNVKVWRSKDRPRLSPADLINTPVSISVKVVKILKVGEHLSAQGREFSDK